MTNIVEKLRLHEMAEEDVWFARHDLELLDALHRKQLRQLADCGDDATAARQAQDFEERFAEITETHADSHGHLVAAYRGLLADIARVCKRRH